MPRAPMPKRAKPVTNAQRRRRAEELVAERGLAFSDICYDVPGDPDEVCSRWFFDADAGRAVCCDECATFLKVVDTQKWGDFPADAPIDSPAGGFTDDDAQQLWLDEVVQLVSTLKLTKAQRAQFEWLGLAP